ncbi:hypothetical protein PPERSA_09713 [Pseudocohnilembus persalinus]|uniref:Fe2OG dioxygenase domain-containing protein n=1 Tax=Pseudocohnilembus persalinus TaxID=266149 RepID=A0A0V0QW40_PSEPJ|nr:hypothetical protein PPERSA_09713 [Pseudocohnilembus persalinus]|eukprot:KRX06101.1 hypothetical protein PPERSA_09713 [Pseudocohnilembus persalinus]
MEELIEQQPEYSPKFEELCDLNLLGNNKHPYFQVEVEKLEKNLKKNGFCFLILPLQLQEASKNLVNASKEVLGKIPQNQSGQYFAAPGFGYCDKGNKQSLTYLTGQFLQQEKEMGSICPPVQLNQQKGVNKNIQESVKNVSVLFDNASKYIFKNVPCFQKIAQNGSQEIPLLRKRVPQFGMLDVVRYQGRSGYKVDSHVDPGIFSISVFSSDSGLQLKNSEGKWIQAPYKDKMFGIIWNGLAANRISKGEMAQGWHRVAPSQEDRYTMWYECVVNSQVDDKIQNGGILALKGQNQLYLQQINKNNNQQIDEKDKININVQAQNGKNFNMVLDKKKDTVGTMKFKMEDINGLRMSKTAMPPQFNDNDKIGSIFGFNKNQANLNMQIEQNNTNNNFFTSNPNSYINPVNNSQYNIFQQSNQSLQPIQMNGYKRKQATDSQYQEMMSHVKNCNHKQCHVVWKGNWGPFIGGQKGGAYFDLTECAIGRKMNEAIHWNYNDPNN